jgi:hypothetical protein
MKDWGWESGWEDREGGGGVERGGGGGVERGGGGDEDVMDSD